MTPNASSFSAALPPSAAWPASVAVVPKSRTSTRPDHRPSNTIVELLKFADSALRAFEDIVWELREQMDAARAQAAECANEMQSELSRNAAMAKRVKTTGWMLTKIAVGYRLHLTRSALSTKASSDRALQKLHRKSARLFAKVSDEQGGAFLKVGQILSSRPDLMPQAWIDELSKLQDSARPEPFARLQSDLAQLGEGLFATFESDPIAAASIGQVHRATLQNGTDVAVKIQRPLIDALIDADMRLLTMFMTAMIPRLPEADYDTILGQIRRAITSETDYTSERQQMNRIGTAIVGLKGVRIPQAFDQASNKRVLTTEFIEGKKISVWLEENRDDKERVSSLLNRLLHAYLHQVLVVGAFQADPHPGNFLVTENDELILLDFGCVQELPEEVRDRYLKLLQAFLVNDEKGLIDHLMALGFRTRSGRPDTLQTFANAMLSEFRKSMMSGASLQWPTQDEMKARMVGLMDSVKDDPVDVLPQEFVMLGRVFLTLGGLFAHYKPSIDIAGMMSMILAASVGR
ncbi:MAG: AarF/ABC1/UbiB kinase family protein [Polyangiales bacterium]